MLTGVGADWRRGRRKNRRAMENRKQKEEEYKEQSHTLREEISKSMSTLDKRSRASWSRPGERKS